MVDKIISIFKKNKIQRIEDLKNNLKIFNSNEFVELIKNTEKLIKQKKIYQLKNDIFIYLENDLYFEGKIKINTSGFAFVYSEEIFSEIYIPKGKIKNAITGDIVKVKITSLFSNKNIEGIITEILERNSTQTVGNYFKAKLFSYVKSDDININKHIKILNDKTFNLVNGSKVLVEITEYSSNVYEEHKGIIIQCLGHKNDPGIDILSIVHKYKIPAEFSTNTLSETEEILEEVNFDEDYRDCTNELVITIDGDDSKDLDDAISLLELEKGYRLKVFIADVSRYVKENSYLDNEAKERGCSVYLLNKVIPMLPQKLSNNVCSLNPNLLRYTICVEINYNNMGNIEKYNIYPAIIKSKGRLTYKKVNLLFENNNKTLKEYQEYKNMLYKMLELSRKIRSNRESRGAIDFEKLESKIILDEYGKVKDIVLRERKDAEKLIEDFMISANEVIAEHFYWLDLPFIYRIHEEPKAEKLKNFFDLSASCGYRVQGNIKEIEPYMLANLLLKFKDKKIENMLSTILLRTMNQARYSDKNIGHFALSSKYYTHFTSPIRRYPDLIVHRLIRKYIFENNTTLETKKHYENILLDIAEKSSVNEKRAVDCEREVEQAKKCEYMLKYLNKNFEGIISSVTRFGIFITLPNTVEGLCHIKNMKDDYYEYYEKETYLLGKRTRKIYRIGDEVKVKLDSVDVENREINFKIINAENKKRKRKINVKYKNYSK